MPPHENENEWPRPWKRILRNFAWFLPWLLPLAAVWWFGYHWLERRFKLDDDLARYGTQFVLLFVFAAIMKLTGWDGKFRNASISPGLQWQQREWSQSLSRRSRFIWIVAITGLFLTFALSALLTGKDYHLTKSDGWSFAVLATFSVGLGPSGIVWSSPWHASDELIKAERGEAAMLGYAATLFVSVIAMIYASYRPGSSSFTLPMIVFVAILVPQIRLALAGR